MSDANPFIAPTTDDFVEEPVQERLAGYEYKRLRKLYLRSSNVNCITALLIIGLVVLVIAGFGLISSANRGGIDEGLAILGPIYLGLAGFYFFAAIGLVMRTAWGRVLGIIVCILSLPSIPLGTIIGIAGLFAFFGAGELFGKNRLPHKMVKAVYKERHKAMKDEKKARKKGGAVVQQAAS